MAYLHTPQICGTCRGVKVGIHGLLNWTAENLYLGFLHEDLRHRTWTEEIPVEKKLHGSPEDLRRTASFVREACMSI
jgi:hypothetical protein